MKCVVGSVSAQYAVCSVQVVNVGRRCTPYTVHFTVFMRQSVLFHIPSRLRVHFENHGQLVESLAVYQVIPVAAAPSLVSHGVP